VGKTEPLGMIHQPIPELSVGEDQSGSAVERELRRDGLVGQRATAKKDLRPRSSGDRTEQGLGPREVSGERRASV